MSTNSAPDFDFVLPCGCQVDMEAQFLNAGDDCGCCAWSRVVTGPLCPKSFSLRAAQQRGKLKL